MFIINKPIPNFFCLSNETNNKSTQFLNLGTLDIGDQTSFVTGEFPIYHRIFHRYMVTAHQSYIVCLFLQLWWWNNFRYFPLFAWKNIQDHQHNYTHRSLLVDSCSQNSYSTSFYLWIKSTANTPSISTSKQHLYPPCF